MKKLAEAVEQAKVAKETWVVAMIALGIVTYKQESAEKKKEG